MRRDDRKPSPESCQRKKLKKLKPESGRLLPSAYQSLIARSRFLGFPSGPNCSSCSSPFCASNNCCASRGDLGLGSFFIPLLVVFLGLSLFYRLTPRRPMRFAEIWAAARCAAQAEGRSLPLKTNAR